MGVPPLERSREWGRHPAGAGLRDPPVPSTHPGERAPRGDYYDGAIATTVLATGRTLKLGFAQRLAAPPAGLTDHFEAVIGGARWPLGTAEVDPADPRALLVALKEPVVGNKTGTARGGADVRYDGRGGLTDGDGNVVRTFWSSGPNHSTYELRTPWADQVGPERPRRRPRRRADDRESAIHGVARLHGRPAAV